MLIVQNESGVEIAIGARIKALREKRGWSRSRLAKQSGVSEVYIAQVENGTRPKVGVSIILAFARAFRVSLDEITGFDVSALPPEASPETSDEQLARLREEVAQLRSTMQQALEFASKERAGMAQEIEQAARKKPPRRAAASPGKPSRRKGR